MSDIDHPKLLVFIPTYRCAAQVKRVIDQFDQSMQDLIDTVMVVDNRSSDGTLEVAIEYGRDKLKSCKFIVWLNSENYGLGGSHKAAFRYATSEGFDYLIVLHGDDQADIRDLRTHLNGDTYKQYDCFLGARFMPSSKLLGYSLLRSFGNRLYNKLFSLAVFRCIYDLGSGLNVYRLEAFREFYYKHFPDDLTFNYIMLLASYHRGQRIGFFPISWREDDQRSNVKLFSQAIKVLKLLCGYLSQRNSFLNRDLRSHLMDEYSGQIVYPRDKNDA